MKFVKSFLLFIVFLVLAVFCYYQLELDEYDQTTICNPIDISYRFTLGGTSFREAASPTMVMFKNEYYLFVAKSGGYWHSKDMAKWDLITTEDLPIEDRSPTAVVLNDTMYFMASFGSPSIFRSADPKSGKWEEIRDNFPYGQMDPCLFVDDNKRMYLYYGCSDKSPIYGIEINTKNFNPKGKPKELIDSHKDDYGWERKGDNNELKENPWMEGAWMTKHHGKYYLQYAAPGTQYKGYCDGVYVSDSPLGNFKLAPNNPISYKPGGFIAGAGHSSTFQDRYGNYWHISTMTISRKHIFERRIGIFPMFFDKDSELYTYTAYGDFPMILPRKKISSPEDLSPKWMLLSYRKPVTVSSELDDYPKDYTVDEDVRTYWSASSGKKGEWIIVDLEKECIVNAVQLNYAENNTTITGRNSDIYCQYDLECSSDKKHWETIKSRKGSKKDLPHDYIELKKPVKARYIKLTNRHVPDGTFALSGLRVFGSARGALPKAVDKLRITRSDTDRCIVKLKWQTSPGTVGYTIRYGNRQGKLYHFYQVFDSDSLIIGSLNRFENYYFTIDAFNENGITKGAKIVHVD